MITLVRPRMTRIFSTQEPITLPSAMDVLPFKAATRLVANSGIEVPKPRIVMPITASDTPRSVASSVAWSTNRLLPRTSSIRPTVTFRYGL